MAMPKQCLSDRGRVLLSVPGNLPRLVQPFRERNTCRFSTTRHDRESLTLAPRGTPKTETARLSLETLRRPKHSEPDRHNKVAPAKRRTFGDTRRVARRARTKGVSVDDIPASSLPKHRARHPAMPSHMHDKDWVSGIVHFWILGRCRLALHLLYIAFPVDLPTLGS